jgi:MOSC domain-containing protein YiiM
MKSNTQSKIVSINISLPKLVEINGKQVLTGIYKKPVENRLWLTKLALVGDDQADKTVHGGAHQAVYSYPLEHYDYWQKVLGIANVPIATFGENFTVTGLNENNTLVGDILQIGNELTGAVVQVTMPRIPCFKFGHKIGHPDILDDFLRSGRSGFYQRVLTEGEVGVNDKITLLDRDPASISIRTALGLQKLGEGNARLLKQALNIKSLAPLLRNIYEERLALLEAN